MKLKTACSQFVVKLWFNDKSEVHLLITKKSGLYLNKKIRESFDPKPFLFIPSFMFA